MRGCCVNMQCVGVAGSCKMATNFSDDDGVHVLLGGVEWSSSPVTFHRNKGKNVKLTESNTVATRTKGYDYGIVFTSEPMIVGQMLKVTMTERVEGHWLGGMVRAHLACALFTVRNQIDPPNMRHPPS